MAFLPTELKLEILQLTSLHADHFKACIALSCVSKAFHIIFAANKHALLVAHIQHTIRDRPLPYYRLITLMRTEKRSTPLWNEDGVEDRDEHLKSNAELKEAIARIVEDAGDRKNMRLTTEEMCKAIEARHIVRELVSLEYSKECIRPQTLRCWGSTADDIIDRMEVGACASLLRYNATLWRLGVESTMESSLELRLDLTFDEANEYYGGQEIEVNDDYTVGFASRKLLQRLADSAIVHVVRMKIHRHLDVKVGGKDAASMILQKASLKTIRKLYFDCNVTWDRRWPEFVDMCCEIIPFAKILGWTWRNTDVGIRWESDSLRERPLL